MGVIAPSLSDLWDGVLRLLATRGQNCSEDLETGGDEEDAGCPSMEVQ